MIKYELFINVWNFAYLFLLVVSVQKWLILNTFNLDERQYLPHYWSDKNAVVNAKFQSLLGESHQILMTVPLCSNIIRMVWEGTLDSEYRCTGIREHLPTWQTKYYYQEHWYQGTYPNLTNKILLSGALVSGNISQLDKQNIIIRSTGIREHLPTWQTKYYYQVHWYQGTYPNLTNKILLSGALVSGNISQHDKQNIIMKHIMEWLP